MIVKLTTVCKTLLDINFKRRRCPGLKPNYNCSPGLSLIFTALLNQGRFTVFCTKNDTRPFSAQRLHHKKHQKLWATDLLKSVGHIQRAGFEEEILVKISTQNPAKETQRERFIALYVIHFFFKAVSWWSQAWGCFGFLFICGHGKQIPTHYRPSLVASGFDISAVVHHALLFCLLG